MGRMRPTEENFRRWRDARAMSRNRARDCGPIGIGTIEEGDLSSNLRTLAPSVRRGQFPGDVVTHIARRLFFGL